MASAPAASPTNATWDWKKRIDQLRKRFDAHKNRTTPDYDASDYESDEEEENVPWEVLHKACMLANKAQMTGHPDTAQIFERVQELHNEVIDDTTKKQLSYAGIKTFADRPSTLVKDSMHSFMGHPSGDSMANAMARFIGDLTGRPASPPSGRTILPWMRAQQPHPTSTRLARFRTGTEFPSPSTHPLATTVLQARCEVYDEAISEPFGVALSDSGACLAVAARGGYKARDPVLLYWLPTRDANFQQNCVLPPLVEPGAQIALDDARQLMFVADRDRVKSFSWADESGRPVHTLNCMKTHKGPLALLPNGRILRAGEGSALCWTLDELPTHGPGPKYKRIGAGKYSWANCWRDREDEDEEYSTGSQPSTTLTFAGGFVPRSLHIHEPSGHMLAGEDPDKGFGCVALDLEHGGAIAARYLGHAGTIADFSTSEGDANVFLTSAADGYARLYDRRKPLPVLTFDVEKQEAPLMTAVLAHVDGLPIVFSGGNKTEGIKCWDVRAKKCAYELSTGNTSIMGLAWSPVKSTLYAAGECSYKDWMGSYHSYRDFNTSALQSGEIMPPKTIRSPVYWPDRAIHVENTFGYAYDAGSHVMLRYAFKEQPELDVVPHYGNGQPSGSDFGFPS